MSKQLTIHCYVSGLVQGVWFRANTQKEAKRLGITGWVKNLSDKRVEVKASGDEEKIKLFYSWLQKGPEKAKVSEVSYEEHPYEHFSKFEIT